LRKNNLSKQAQAKSQKFFHKWIGLMFLNLEQKVA